MEKKTSLYVAYFDPKDIPSYKTCREEIWAKIMSILKPKGYIGEEQYHSILYDGYKIIYKVNFPYRSGVALITFFPYGFGASHWTEEKNKNAIRAVIKICDMLGDQLSISSERALLNFQREVIREDDNLNIGRWTVSLLCTNPQERLSLDDFLNTRYLDLLDKIKDVNINVVPFTGDSPGTINQRAVLEKALGGYTTFDSVKRLQTAREFIEKHSWVKDTVCLFIDTPATLDIWYAKYKIHFCKMGVPTQFINIPTIDKIPTWKGVKVNFLAEMLTKVDKRPFALKPPREMLDIDGFLCLSDIRDKVDAFFGALITYSGEGASKEEEVQIYSDIRFEEKEDDRIHINDDDLELLADKVGNLVARSVKIDILITKEWDYIQLDKIIKQLIQKGLEVNRVYYISTKTSRFVDESVLSDHPDAINPYFILGDRVGFIRTSTRVRVFQNLPMVYAKLAWPDSAKMEEKDLAKILWLTKKRLYRRQEFAVLDIPEPIIVLRRFNRVLIGDIDGRLTIPVRLLI